MVFINQRSHNWAPSWHHPYHYKISWIFDQDPFEAIPAICSIAQAESFCAS